MIGPLPAPPCKTLRPARPVRFVAFERRRRHSWTVQCAALSSDHQEPSLTVAAESERAPATMRRQMTRIAPRAKDLINPFFGPSVARPPVAPHPPIVPFPASSIPSKLLNLPRPKSVPKQRQPTSIGLLKNLAKKGQLADGLPGNLRLQDRGMWPRITLANNSKSKKRLVRCQTVSIAPCRAPADEPFAEQIARLSRET